MIGYGAVSMRGPVVLIALLSVALLAAGCGDDTPAKPQGSPRAAVLRYLDDIQAGRTAAACAAMNDETKRFVRVSLLGSLRIPPGTHAARRRYIEEQRVASLTCAGTMRLAARLLSISKIRERAVSAKLRRMTSVDAPGPVYWTLGDDQDWVLKSGDSRWIVDGSNALQSDA